MTDEIRQHSPRQSAAATWTSSHGPVRAIVCLLVGVLLVIGCSSSTDPGGGGGDDPPVIAFSPVNQGQSIKLSESMLFSASVTPDVPLTVSWRREGLEVGTGATYLFVPVDVGPDTLRVQATAGSTSREYYWVVDVAEDPSSIPPAVPNVVIEPGPLPTEVEVSWNRIPASTFPIQEYIVAFRLDGPVTMDNWETSQVLGVYPAVEGHVGYSTLADSTDGMPPGETVWFGVRGRDLHDQLSLWGDEYSTQVTWPWWIDGRIYLDTNEPAPVGVIIESFEPPFSDNTDGQGFFRLGPFRNIDQITMKTTSSNAVPGGWYDFITQPYGYEQPDAEIVLLSRFGLADDYCDPPFNPNGDFLTYFMNMTMTKLGADDPPKISILHRWESYPLAVYIPEVTAPSGVAMHEAALEAVAIWNFQMGEEYFVLVADPVDADVVFVFKDFPNYAGLVELVEPAPGGEVQLGRVVPEKMSVTVDTGTATTPDITKATCLHELGHVLGLFEHSTCAQIGYLMTVGGGGSLDWTQPIHPDEMNGVRSIRYLPQGVDMNDFQESR